MLGFGALGQRALGQVGSVATNSPILIGVSGTGAIGSFAPTTGSLRAVYGTGAVGLMLTSTLQVNSRRLLANVLRRLRTLSPGDPDPT